MRIDVTLINNEILSFVSEETSLDGNSILVGDKEIRYLNSFFKSNDAQYIMKCSEYDIIIFRDKVIKVKIFN